MDDHENATISSGTQDVARQSPARTLFAERTLAYQENQTRTKGDVLGTGLGILAIGLLVTVACGVGLFLVGGFWVFILGTLIGIVLIVVAPVVLLVGALSPTKKVSCPSCRAEHRVLRSTQKYICPKCLELLRLGKGPVCHMAFVTCPYCDHKAAVSEDHGLFVCSNCGLLCTSNGDRQSTEDTNCPTCGRVVPEEALYCVSCDSTLKTGLPAPPSEDPGLAYDEDWVAGKDAVGHFHFARVLLEQIRAETPCPPSTRHEESPIRQIEKALLSLGQVAADPNTRPRCLVILPDVDQVYARVLRWELDVAEIRLSAKELTPVIKEVIEVIAYEIPTDEQHISARRQLETLLGDAVRSTGSIGKWSDKLLVWRKEQTTKSSISVFMTQDVDFYVLAGCEGLRNEVTRFSQWLKSRGLGMPESLLPSPASDTQQPRDAGLAQGTAPGAAATESDVCRLDIESQILPVLQKHRSANGLFIAPDIPQDKLKTAMLNCNVPGHEEIAALIDCTVWGSAKNCLLVGLFGLYMHNGRTGKKPGPTYIPYLSFARGRVRKEGRYEIAFDDDHFLDVSGCGMPKDTLLVLLSELQSLCRVKADASNTT